MAKFKPVGSKKKAAANSKRGLLPCAVVLVIIFSAIFWICYLVLRSS